MISFLIIWILWIIPVIVLEIKFTKNKSNEDIFNTAVLWPLYLLGMTATTLLSIVTIVVNFIETKIVLPKLVNDHINTLKGKI